MLAVYSISLLRTVCTYIHLSFLFINCSFTRLIGYVVLTLGFHVFFAHIVGCILYWSILMFFCISFLLCNVFFLFKYTKCVLRAASIRIDVLIQILWSLSSVFHSHIPIGNIADNVSNISHWNVVIHGSNYLPVFI